MILWRICHRWSSRAAGVSSRQLREGPLLFLQGVGHCCRIRAATAATAGGPGGPGRAGFPSGQGSGVQESRASS
eukprot:1144311-Pelagomonas_calceolata.AAC.3